MVGLGVVGLVVDAHDERSVNVGAWSRDEDLLGASIDVLLCVLDVGEAPRRLDDDVDTEVTPGKECGVALGKDLDLLAVDDDVRLVVRDVGVQATRDRVVLEQGRERLGVGQVVDGDDVEGAALCECCAEIITSDSTEAVDSDFDAHKVPI